LKGAKFVDGCCDYYGRDWGGY